MRLIVLSLLALACVASFPCEWPVLSISGRRVRLATRVVQRLLNDTTITGVYDQALTNKVKAYQTAHGISPADGVMRTATWTVLMKHVGDLRPGSSGTAVVCAQDLLGLPTLNGHFDAATGAALAKYQQEHLATVTDGSIVDQQTWHLLVSQCNASRGGVFWFDAGWPQGSMTVETLSCLRHAGFEMAKFQCWRQSSGWWPACVGNIARAWEAGYKSVNVYMFPQRNRSASVQVGEMLGLLKQNNVKFGGVMLDIEGNDWSQHTHEDNQRFMLGLRAAYDEARVPLYIYCGPGWTSYFGSNFTAFSDRPVVYAHYDNVPSYVDWPDNTYGGWKHPAGKQFWDGQRGEILCNSGALDWDWSEKPFW